MDEGNLQLLNPEPSTKPSNLLP